MWASSARREEKVGTTAIIRDKAEHLNATHWFLGSELSVVSLLVSASHDSPERKKDKGKYADSSHFRDSKFARCFYRSLWLCCGLVRSLWYYHSNSSVTLFSFSLEDGLLPSLHQNCSYWVISTLVIPVAKLSVFYSANHLTFFPTRDTWFTWHPGHQTHFIFFYFAGVSFLSLLYGDLVISPSFTRSYASGLTVPEATSLFCPSTLPRLSHPVHWLQIASICCWLPRCISSQDTLPKLAEIQLLSCYLLLDIWRAAQS